MKGEIPDEPVLNIAAGQYRFTLLYSTPNHILHGKALQLAMHDSGPFHADFLIQL
ncbi:hypothetical protein AAHD29_001259 [Citrobacter freundii]|nr:hypothetical protein [Citrobacter freundii]HAT2419024.1 hypothetical protein [Citrobacter freundii]HAT2423593.1 hypothetical protein [Citrobacter freundii]HAT3812723.1 hypothetical protein [Citrobacter freundii]